RAERILSEQDLRSKLQRSADTARPLRIKLGMDPTAPDVTLGHAVPLSIVRQFQEWGHKAVIIIGDYTARVDDPSGRNEPRPLLQGWDSVMIQADVEMGGSDQLFNNMVGREFQKEENPTDPLAGQVVIVTPLLVGTDGHVKMSKSKGNYIGVTDAPADMFGKI